MVRSTPLARIRCRGAPSSEVRHGGVQMEDRARVRPGKPMTPAHKRDAIPSPGVRGLVTPTPTGPSIPKELWRADADAHISSTGDIHAGLLPQGDDPIFARVKVRARLVSYYARLQGREALPHTIVAALATHGAITVLPPPNVLAAALGDLGLEASVVSAGTFAPEQWPALAEMTGGQLILVLGQTETTLSVYDPTRPGEDQKIELREFEPFFTGSLIRIAPQNTTPSRAKRFGLPRGWQWVRHAFPQLHQPVRMVALGAAAINALAFCLAAGVFSIFQNGLAVGAGRAGLTLVCAAAFIAACEVFLRLYRQRLVGRSQLALIHGARRAALEPIITSGASHRAASPEGLEQMLDRAGLLERMFRPDRVWLLADLPFGLIALAAVFALVGNAAWLVVLMGIFMVGSTVGFQLWARKDANQQTAPISGAAKAALQALPHLLQADAIGRFRDAWESLLASRAGENLKSVTAAIAYWPVLAFAVALTSVIALYGYLGLGGQLTLGAIVAGSLLSARALDPLSRLPGAVHDLSAFRQTVLRDDSRLPVRKLQGLLELHHVAHRTGLSIKTTTIHPWERLALLDDGRPAGKDLFAILSGQTTPDQGQVWIDGLALSQIDPKDHGRDVGYLLEQTPLFDGTLRDNLRSGDNRDADLMRALDFVGLDAAVREHPEGLGMGIGDDVIKRQAAAIGWARLWLQNPSVAFLNRPTALEAGSETANRLQDWLAERTVVMLTDRRTFLQAATRILVLNGGQPMIDGPAEHVIPVLNGKAAYPKSPELTQGVRR